MSRPRAQIATSPRLDPRTVETARQLRPASPGAADIEGLLSTLGVSVNRVRLPRPLLGLTTGASEIQVHRGLVAREMRFVLAHELAHVLVRRGQCDWVRPLDEETFADRFAHELLLPSIGLRTSRTGTGEGLSSRDCADLAERFDVDPQIVMLQRATAGLGPAISRHGANVLCVACGLRPSRSACACNRFRQRPELDLPAAA